MLAGVTGNPDGSVLIDTKLNTAGFGKGAANLKNQFNGLGASVQKLGKLVAAAFSVKAIIAFGKEAIELGSDLQEVQNVVDVTFTTMNEQVNEFAKNAAMTAGLSEKMAKQYAGTFGAMAKSFGFTEEEAYNMSTALVQLSGDVASFYNLSQDAAYTKLKSVFTGETESLKDLGVVMTQTALDDFALRKGFGKTTDQMSEQEKVALRYQFVLEQLNTASGDFLRTSNSWANQTKLLSLQFDSLKATLGQGLINVLTPVLQLLNTLIAKLQQFAVAFRDLTESLFGSASEGSTGSIADTLGEAANNAEQLEEATTDAGKAAKKATAGFDELNVLSTSSGSGASGASGGSATVGGETIPGAAETYIDNTSGLDIFRAKLEDTLNWFKTTFQPSISSWGDAFSKIAPIVENAGSRISNAFGNLWNDSLSPFGSYLLTDFVPSIANTFSKTFAPIFEDIMPVAFDIFATDFENSCLIVEESTNQLNRIFEGVKSVFSDMCETISFKWEEYGGKLLDGFQRFRESLWDIWWNIYESIIKPVTDIIGEAFTWLWDSHLKKFWDKCVEFFFSVGDAALSLWNNYLKPLVDFWVAYLSPMITNAIRIVVDAVKIAVGWISDAIGAIITILDGVINFLVGIFTLDFKRAWEGIEKIFTGMWDGLVGTFKAAVNSIILIMNALIAAIWSGIAGIVNGLGSIVSSVGDMLGKDWGFSVPAEPYQIPYLAHGAVIPPNAPFLAVLGDQRHGTNIEAPLDTIKQALAEVLSTQNSGGNGETVVNVNFTGDLAQLARILKPVIDTETRRKGGSLAKGGISF